MHEKWQNFKHKDGARFWLRTLLYFGILVVLMYLYSYSGINNSGFIYNEF
ncbi:teichoic acid D-Ala incorporation-associated protein DltX [Agrilactobacillus yilanensis]|uniref:Teichoic acid D-Ala incorporation-associated protein DltX n=1 Tax=Agrilactobacillus yilanensis TaxID=2485997 RepID=A0ABW4J7T1_9LACO|nr:teichoic acid D-Ala incorporation-associated protein DltX [Agrilactobacillus yilanensis]